VKQQVEEREEDALLIDAVVEVDQDLKKEMIEVTEEAETIDQPQDLKKEMIEVTEEAETIDQPQDLKKILLVKKVLLRKKGLEINFNL
jgi:hypothetical protein